MPNWCSNSFTVTAKTKARLKKFMVSVASGRGKNRNVFDFNKIIPEDETNKKYWVKVYRRNNAKTGPMYCDEAVSIDHLVALAPENSRIKSRNGDKLIGYGFNWYDWHNKFWGTKWNACSPFDGEPYKTYKTDSGEWSVEYEFDTAWSPASPVYKAMVEQNPDLTFAGHYEEPGMCFAGNWVGKDGEYEEEPSELEVEEDED